MTALITLLGADGCDGPVPGVKVLDDEEPLIEGRGRASLRPAGAMAAMRLVSVRDGAVYDVMGRPLEGGEARLRPLPGFNQFWFAWSAFHDGSEVFGQASPNTSGPIVSDGECIGSCDRIRLACPGTDCIPALSEPRHVAPGGSESDYLERNSFVVGVEVGDDVRAYPHNVLWWHEIVNDTVGGVPLAITHCPLTFSSLAFDRARFGSREPVELGVSGRLFNRNLIFYDRSSLDWYVQLPATGARGASLGRSAPQLHVWEMSWEAWQALNPGTTVLSDRVRYARNYDRYPYLDYFDVDQDGFAPLTVPLPDPRYGEKQLTYGLRVPEGEKAWVHDELAAWARRTFADRLPPGWSEDQPPAAGVLEDTVGGRPVTIVFDIDAGYVQAFESVGELELRYAD